jgi:hypothetical protein
MSMAAVGGLKAAAQNACKGGYVDVGDGNVRLSVRPGLGNRFSWPVGA